MQTPSNSNLISVFCNHAVAANLLMAMLLLAGFWGLKQLNTQFFPSFNLDYVTVRTVWSSASAADIEELVTIPLEQELRDVDFVKYMTSTSSEGVSSITLEFEEGSDIGLAVGLVKQRVDLLRDLPNDAEEPQVSQVVQYEGVASLLITGANDIDELRVLVKRFEAELLARGIAKIFIHGLPQEQIAIEVSARQLRRLGLSLDDIGRRVAAWSQDVPVGIVGRDETSRQLRFRERRTTELAFESIAVVAEPQGRLLPLGAIANIERQPKPEQISLRYRDQPAVEMSLHRTENHDSLAAAKIFRQWLDEVRPTLPVGVELLTFNESWMLLQDRINLLVKNGLGGLLLVVMILFLFLSGRVAWWTAVGIPVSFMAALAVLYLVGGSLNMISLFGLIMALGIIVDDAIVVGEEAMTQHQQGVPPHLASQHAAQQMLGPVLSSSLTTIAAFMPLLLVGGIIGAIMQAIPVVVICIIIASLVECFLILPGHLTHSFRKMGEHAPGKANHPIRQWLDNAFEQFREGWFRPGVTLAIANRWTTVSIAVALLIFTVGWLQSGRISFQFFPAAEADRIYANVGFVAGTSSDKVKTYLKQMQQTLSEVEQELNEKVVKLVVVRHGAVEGTQSQRSGDQFGSVRVELLDPDQRRTRNHEIIKAWRNKLPRRPGVENLSIVEPRAGPPGKDIDIRVSGEDIARVKLAAQSLQHVLKDISGVSGVSDDTPYGREQMVLELTPNAEALGLSVDNISRQLRAAYNGYKVQALSDGYDDLEVRVLLPRAERNTVTGLDALPVVLQNGATAPISNLARLRSERGFDVIRHSNGKLSVTVTGNIDPSVNNTNRIHSDLEANILPQLTSTYGVQFSFEGRQAEQAETLGDMQLGMMLALVMIYFVLAWVFGSYGLPLLVMAIIPFGMVGAVWGHVVMQQNLTLLSLFGFFALSGVVVNDSIILVVCYKKLREQGLGATEAAISAACKRLRAVLLTSLTTIAGLTPLLFETSLQAQFLIPMAITLAFGLAFATLLVLVIIPSLLLIYENALVRVSNRNKQV